MIKYIFKNTLLLLLPLLVFTACAEEEVAEPENISNPQVITINQLKDSVSVDGISKYLGQWVQINDVQFLEQGPFNSTGSNAGGGKSIIDKNSNTALVHTSPDRDFAFLPMPETSGTIKAYVSQYEDKIQLLLKNVKDATVGMDQPRFPVGQEVMLSALDPSYKDKVVVLKDVQFAIDDVGLMFNGTDSNGNGSKTLTDCSGGSATFFTFKTDPHTDKIIPKGKEGKMYVKVGEFSGKVQLYLVGEMPKFAKSRCN